jgi:type IV pilus assembly protein PilN
MRLNINLASQKFEDVRRFYVRWGTAIALTAALALVLIFLAWKNYTDSVDSSARIKNLQQRIATLQRERAEAEAISNRPENHDVTTQKNFWNKQIARRALSWTQLFNDLQRIMPARAYVSSVHPEITPDNRLKLSLEILGDKHDNALELVQKMEKSERFRGPKINSDTSTKDQKTGTTIYKLDIETYYTPTVPPQQRSTTREGL